MLEDLLLNVNQEHGRPVDFLLTTMPGIYIP